MYKYKLKNNNFVRYFKFFILYLEKNRTFIDIINIMRQ